MEGRKHTSIEEMELFKRYLVVADWAWDAVKQWNHFSAGTIGKQLVRAADSIGAHLVEGDGRGSDTDALRFFIYARASARETRYWIQRAAGRGLVQPAEAEARINDLVGATQLLNHLIAYRRSANVPDRARENRAAYEVDGDVFTA